MDRIDVETSRHVRLNYEPASLAHRILAWGIDASLYVIYIIVFMWIWGGILPSEISDNLNLGWIPNLMIMLPYFIYFPLIETLWNGRTIGKKLLGIRVTKLDGTRAGLGDYIIRWLFRFFEISGTGGVVAILTILINGKGQRLGDIVAKTCVIMERGRDVSHRDLFLHTQTDREVVFSSAAELEDKDVHVIRTLLSSKKDYSPRARRELMNRSRKLIEQKIGAEDSSMSSEKYLKTVIRDYYTIYGSKVNDK